MNQLFSDLEKIHLTQLKELNTIKPVPESAPAPQKTLDQMLDARSQQDTSLKKLDAELAQFDALGDMVAENAKEDEPAQAPAPVEDTLQRQVVEKIVVNGAANDAEDSGEELLSDDDPDLQKVDAMSMGNWVELHQDDGKKFRCRLAAVIRSTGKYIFVNRSGMKVAEYNRQSLAHALKTGAVTAIDDGLLFDRALESVIGNLRDMNSSAHSH